MSASYCQMAQQETKDLYTHLDKCNLRMYVHAHIHTHTRLTSAHYVLGILKAESHSLTVAGGARPAEPQHTQQKG